MPVLKLNNAEFYYELHGEGFPLVLIAGLKGDSKGWLPVLSDLAKNHQVLIFDNRGAGQTIDSGEAFDVEKMAEDTMALVNALGLKMPKIVGHSMGGAVAQVIGKKYSTMISSIVLCNTFIKLNEKAKDVFMHTLTVHESGASQAEIMDTLIPWVFSKKFITPEVIKIIKETSNENPYPQSLCGYRRQMQALTNFDSSSWANYIDIPTLIIASDEDLIAMPGESRLIADKVKNSKLVILPTGHASQVEAPNQFIDALNNFYSCA